MAGSQLTSPSGTGGHGTLEILETVVEKAMSNACDPRNRPGFVEGDVTAYLPEPVATSPNPADDFRTVLLAGFSTLMIVATVFGIVLLTQ